MAGRRATAGKDEIDDVLNAIQGDLNAAFGADAAMRLDAQETLSRVDHWVSSRSIIVDAVLRGGRPMGASLVPFGRQIEVSGPPNSGKTTLCAHIAAEVQAKGGLVIVTDTEERIDHVYWGKLGVDVSRVLRIHADSVKEVFNKQYRALQFARDKAPDKQILLIWDSLGGTAGVDMVDPDSKDDPMTQAEKFNMRKAKQIGDGIVLINSVITQTRTCYLYTNHEYTQIGTSWGDPRETHGGMKVKYYATVRLRLTPAGQIKEKNPTSDHDTVVGQKIRVKALKNSMAGVLKECDAAVMANRGYVNSFSVWDMAQRLGLISKAGAWSEVKMPGGGKVSFQGFNGFEEKVVTHDEYPELLAHVVEAL
jgi:recombination protein RecA